MSAGGAQFRTMLAAAMAVFVLAAGCSSGPSDAAGPSPDAVQQSSGTVADVTTQTTSPPPPPDPTAGPVELTRFAGCHDVTVWAANDDATVAVVVRSIAPDRTQLPQALDVVLADTTEVQVDLYVGHGLDHVVCSYVPDLAFVSGATRVREGTVRLSFAAAPSSDAGSDGDDPASGPYEVSVSLDGLATAEWQLSDVTTPMLEVGVAPRPNVG